MMSWNFSNWKKRPLNLFISHKMTTASFKDFTRNKGPFYNGIYMYKQNRISNIS